MRGQFAPSAKGLTPQRLSLRFRPRNTAIPQYRKTAFALLALLLTTLVLAQPTPHPLRVATRIIPPFVIQGQNKLSGFSIDLWDSLSKSMGIQSTYLVKPTVADLLSAVKSKQADVGIAAISITEERDRDFDFSQPMFEAGLQIMTRADSKTANPNPVARVADQIISSGVILWLLTAFLIGLIPAHIVWLVERKHPNCTLQHRSYYPGVFEAYWWTLACLATQAEDMPRSVLGRIMAVLWMFTAVVFIAFFTAQVTATATVQQLQGDINGPDDLPGRKVATTQGSTSAEYLRDRNTHVEEFSKIEDAYAALAKGDADAVVFDSPVLQYYVAHEGKGKFELVSEVFRKENYGIVFPPNSPYRKPIERALLAARENGDYQRLYDQWFGKG